ncbi:hypothetical protein GALMADRAFT_226745 [Galerina marginata CBS 339.88]|uniref:LysM domain-containing protein n=1 Tax=Galerina marginata (strain CBS 339.88) TaxID=685588 RepID=A0A067SYF4_GALM3|nr:hypothetical protein GALMADRAFT_226745 [Galerina marginata CBS 339.88]
MSYDESDDLAYNPFAEESDYASNSTSNLAQGYYSSAFFPKLSNSRPTLRRRRSSLTDQSSLKGNERRSKHARSRTEIQIVPHSAGLHPLKSALARAEGTVFQDVGITRPHLSRMVNEATLVDAPLVDAPLSDTVADQPAHSLDQEKEVIVHQVSQNDSLAGVSLKYGISLPNLRRANKLWTSDSIHIRHVLYIPIDQASRAREYILEPNLISLTPDPPDPSVNPFDDNSRMNSLVEGTIVEHVPPSPFVNVRRIPANQLSYFPPSTSRNTELKFSGYSEANNPYHQSPGGSKLSPGYNKYSPSPINNSLASILTALPIAASTRDEIITRLSFDSVSSSFSDRSHANSDEEIGHELDDVAKHVRQHAVDVVDEEIGELSMPTPKASQRPPYAVLPIRTNPPNILSSSLPKTSYAHSHSSMSPPRFYVSQANETYIRTSQMEPSAAMQLPNFRSSTVGRRSSGKVLLGNAGGHQTHGSINLDLGRAE